MSDQKKKIVLLDGSFGFQLSKYVSKSLDGDPLWSARSLASDPEAVIRVHLDYIKAGCDIIETNSYQASIPGFMKYLNLSKEESYNLIKKSVSLAKTAIERAQRDGILQGDAKPLIAGSVGPYGAYLHDGSEYNGYYTERISREEFIDYHKSRISALIEGGVDLLAIETIPSKTEAEIIVELIKEYPNIKAWLSFSCQAEGVYTAHGDNFKDAATSCYKLNPDQIIAVGVNCIAPHAVEPLLKEITGIPLIVYANSGEKYDPDLGWDNNCEKLEEYVPIWLNLGVKFIGGCCRVCDNYITKIADEVRKWEENNS
ncbi:homocysteine S-methyltransferase 1-like [Tribolium madens]|uniref:homocysteine S-methyltransferase 1-like n=1 Tax=Tribolium madens TaxID=41895 RepID=UPI001CF755EF|nr:homocysteine S-methyltransferase 1-like [Tribolium madens]